MIRLVATVWRAAIQTAALFGLIAAPSLAPAQSSLPLCPENGRKHNCWAEVREGSFLFSITRIGEFREGKLNGLGSLQMSSSGSSKGSRIVGEFKDGNPEGEAIEYKLDGTVVRSGRWKGTAMFSGPFNLVEPYPIETSRFPFDPRALLAISQRTASPQVTAQTPTQLAAIETEASGVRSESAASARPVDNIYPSAVSRSNAHALVFGNGAYAGSARLDNPLNDAFAMSEKLRSMGFSVTTVTDARRGQMLEALAQFQRSAAGADVSLLYFAGHGVQIDGANFILPTDIDQSDVSKAIFDGIRLSDAIDNFLPGKTKLVLLDACRDNPLQRTGSRSLTRGLAPMNVSQGTLIAYATRDGQVALDGVGQKHSPFTKALLEHLGDPTDISVVLRRVREKVMQATGGKQQPWDYGSLTGGELILSQIRPGNR